jgi:hypothetical protein
LHRRSRPLQSHIVTLAGTIAVIAIAATGAAARSAHYPRFGPPDSTAPRFSSASPAPRLVQDGNDGDDAGVPPDQIEKYVAVYQDMQRNRSLTVETAAAKEGLTVPEFRELERQVGRDEAAREHVRTELQAGAASTP